MIISADDIVYVLACVACLAMLFGLVYGPGGEP